MTVGWVTLTVRNAFTTSLFSCRSENDAATPPSDKTSPENAGF